MSLSKLVTETQVLDLNKELDTPSSAGFNSDGQEGVSGPEIEEGESSNMQSSGKEAEEKQEAKEGATETQTSTQTQTQTEAEAEVAFEADVRKWLAYYRDRDERRRAYEATRAEVRRAYEAAGAATAATYPPAIARQFQELTDAQEAYRAAAAASEARCPSDSFHYYQKLADARRAYHAAMVAVEARNPFENSICGNMPPRPMPAGVGVAVPASMCTWYRFVDYLGDSGMPWTTRRFADYQDGERTWYRLVDYEDSDGGAEAEGEE